MPFRAAEEMVKCRLEQQKKCQKENKWSNAV